jgi:hypothetical protein
MQPKPTDDLESFLKCQDPSTLVGVLIELARDHEAVQERLTRLQLADRPVDLAAAFRQKLAAWRNSSTYVTYREADEFGRTLEIWLDQVDRELLPPGTNQAPTTSWPLQPNLYRYHRQTDISAKREDLQGSMPVAADAKLSHFGFWRRHSGEPCISLAKRHTCC